MTLEHVVMAIVVVAVAVVAFLLGACPWRAIEGG